MAEFPHPDQIQYGVKQAEQGNRYQFYAGACYLLHAKSAAMQGATGLTVKFFTSEDPDSLLADQLKCVLAAPDERDKDAPDIYFPHGIYIEVDGVSGNTDVALVEADWVPREAYCRAYPDQTAALIECWAAAEGRDKERWLENFDPGDPDSGEWSNEGAAGTGGVTGATVAITASSDPTVNDDSDDGYNVGDVWITTSDDGVFILADSTVGAAVWTEVGAGGGTANQDKVVPFILAQGAGSYTTERTLTIWTPQAGDISSIFMNVGDGITANADRYWVFKVYNDAGVVATLSTASTTITANTPITMGSLSNASFDGTNELKLTIQSFNDGTQPQSLNGDYLTFDIKMGVD